MADTPLVQRVKSLSNGISKQAETMRYPNQVADAANIQFSVLTGANRRPGSTQVLNITSGISANQTYGLHMIERDDQERYAIIYSSGILKVVDLIANAEATVNVMGSAAAYLGFGSPKAEDFRFLTIGDTTFVANRKVSTGMLDDNALDPSVMPHQLVRMTVDPLVFRFGPVPWTERNYIEQEVVSTATSGNFKLKYRGSSTADIAYNAKASNFTSGSDGNGIDQRLEDIRTIGSGKVICSFGPLDKDPVLVEISPDIQTGSAAMTLSADGSTVSRADGNLLDTAAASSNTCHTEITITRGNNDRNPPPNPIATNQTIRDMAYYRGRMVLAFQDTLVFSRVDETFNYWIERPGAVSDSDPVILQIASDDVASIDHVVPFQGSLLILTRQGRQYFLEDVTVFSSSTASLVASSRYETQPVKPQALGNNLYLVGSSAQFTPVFQYFFDDLSQANRAVDVSKHVQGFLPKKIESMTGSVSSSTLVLITKPTVEVTPARFFKSDESNNWGNYQTWEISSTEGGTYVDMSNSQLGPQPYDVVEISAGHTVTLNSAESGTDVNGYDIDTTLVASQTNLYSYRWYDVGQERQQSAWTRWGYGACFLNDAKVLDDEVYVLRRQDLATGGELALDKIPLTEDFPILPGFTRRMHLDFQYQFDPATNTGNNVTAAYNAGTDSTTFTVKLNNQAAAIYNDMIDSIVLSGDFLDSSGASLEGTQLSVHSVDLASRAITVRHQDNVGALPVDGVVKVGNATQADGDFTGGRVLIGRKFTSELTLNRMYQRQGEDIPIVQGRTILDRLIVDHTESTGYDITVTPDDNAMPAFTATHTAPSLETGHSRTSITANAETSTIKLTCDKPDSCTWSSYEIHGRNSTNQR